MLKVAKAARKFAESKNVGRRGQLLCAVGGAAVVYVLLFWKKFPSTAQMVYHCNVDAGTKIYRTADDVEGFLGMEGGRQIFELGYKYVVGWERGGGRRLYVPHEGNVSGFAHAETHMMPRYEIVIDVKDGPYIRELIVKIYDRELGIVMAEQKSFSLPPPDRSSWDFFTQYWLRFGRKCLASDEFDHYSLVSSVLRPPSQILLKENSSN